MINGSVYIGTALIFIIFGSVNVQSWNEPSKPVEGMLLNKNVFVDVDEKK